MKYSQKKNKHKIFSDSEIGRWKKKIKTKYSQTLNYIGGV